jgi:hypothetical protein
VRSKPVRRVQAVLQGTGDGYQLFSLRIKQRLRICVAAGEQGELHQQFRSHVPVVPGWPCQPRRCRVPPAGRRVQQRADRTVAPRLLLSGPHQAKRLEPLQRPVDERFGNPPHPAYLAIDAQKRGKGEPVRLLLADQAQHQPLGQ